MNWTPLDRAAMWGQLEAARLLIDRGAAVDSKGAVSTCVFISISTSLYFVHYRIDIVLIRRYLHL